jgi:uncharacterized membrane protein
MPTTIGLVLDVIGAVALSIGLFRHPVPLTPGWLRDPPAAAEDHAYGITGGAFLISGFVLQIVGSTGTPQPVPFVRAMVWAAVTLVVGLVGAYFIYGAAFIWAMRKEMKWVASQSDMPDTRWQRERKGLKFWRHSLVR